jgi:hypothetical protein
MDELNLAHLAEAIQELVGTGGVEQRVAALNAEIFIGHTAVDVGLAELQGVHQNEGGVRPCASAIVGGSGAGKSQLMKSFKRWLEKIGKEDGSAACEMRILEPTFDGDPLVLLREIAQAFDVEMRADVDKLFRDIVMQAKHLRLAALGIEDLHDLFLCNEGSGVRRDRHISQSLKVIRRFMNTTCIPLVFTTIPEGMKRIVMDGQLNGRIQRKVYLPPWARDVYFEEFLTEYEKHLPLKHPSNLTARGIMTWLVKNTESTRHLTQVLRDTARAAILDGSECITLALLKQRYPNTPMTAEAGKAGVKRRAKAGGAAAAAAPETPEQGFVP